MSKSRYLLPCVVSIAFLLGITATPAIACHDGSPVILDLDGDRVRTSGLESNVWFDLNADGVAEHTAWTNSSAEDAFLWMDRNGNDLVDDGGELFGDATILLSGALAESGFHALAEYDAWSVGGNSDGQLDYKDRIWNDLRLWIDSNQDGVSQKSEIFTLAQRGVLRISLDWAPSDRVDGNGNAHRFLGSFEMREKQEIFVREAVDVFFRIGHH